MAKDTNLELRNELIYQVFPRQYSKEGNLEGVRKDLKRIKELGTDILYLLPIHPIGKVAKKGDLGCPYSIQDYRLVDPNIGTLDDLKSLIDDTHKMGMKIIIDVVYNHTSRDSRLLKEHPEWFYRNEALEPMNRVGDWSDVTDFDYTKSHDLWVELIDTLCYWVKLGIDGFRCDVAPLVTKDFWREAREALKKINPDIMLLSESIHLGFVKYIRDLGFDAMSDSETYESFDMLYDYDVRPEQEDYIKGNGTLNDWLKVILKQEGQLPKNYVKARFLDNHDCPRVCSFITDEVKLRNIWALNFFLKGITFVYAGDEAMDPKLPSLFDYDYVDWSEYNKFQLADLFKTLAKIKKDPIFKDGIFEIHFEDKEIAHLSYKNSEKVIEGIFNLGNNEGTIKSVLKDGTYKNLVTNEVLSIKDNLIKLIKNPVIIEGKN